MIILSEGDLNDRADRLFNDNGTLELDDMDVTDFRILSQKLYNASIIMFKSSFTNKRKVLKNRYGKDD